MSWAGIIFILQNMKKIQAEQQNVNRYRLQMSDGTNFQPCMLATQMNEKIESGELDKFSVVRVTRYLCNTIHERRYNTCTSTILNYL